MTSIHPYLANVYPRIIDDINAVRIFCSVGYEEAASERSLHAQMHEGNEIYLTETLSEPDATRKNPGCSISCNCISRAPQYQMLYIIRMLPYIRTKAKTCTRVVSCTQLGIDSKIARNASSEEPN